MVVTFDDEPTSAKGIDTANDSLLSAPESRGYMCDSSSALVASGATPDAQQVGTKTFLPSKPDFRYRGQEASFDAQVNFYKSALPAQFSYQVSSYFTSKATGPVEIASAVRSPVNCTYNKPGVPLLYNFHWSCPTHTEAKGYVFNGHWRWPGLLAGRPAHFDQYWKFNYIIYIRIT